MHYKNGREAKAGDVIISLQTGKTGVLYETVAGVLQCSARIATFSQMDEYVTVGECLHLDDVAHSAKTIKSQNGDPSTHENTK